MSVTRSQLIGGPAKHTRSASSFFSVDDFALTPRISWQDVTTSVHGRVDSTKDAVLLDCTFTPAGIWGYRTILFPYLGTATPGTEKRRGYRIFGSGADTPWAINSFDGELYTLHNAAITKLPDIILGPKANLFGPMTITGLIKNATDPESASSFYTIGAQVYDDSSFDPTAVVRQRYAAAWTGKAGFTAFQAKEQWTIQSEISIQPIEVQGYPREMVIDSIRFMAKCIPVGPTGAQIDAALIAQGTGATEGSRMSAGAADLIITGTGVSVTMKNAAIRDAGYMFGGVPLRNGELGWESTMAFSANTNVSQLILA